MFLFSCSIDDSFCDPLVTLRVTHSEKSHSSSSVGNRARSTSNGLKRNIDDQLNYSQTYD